MKKSEWMTQVDYSEGYHKKYQYEIQSTYFLVTRPSVFLQHVSISMQVEPIISKKF